MNEQQVKEWLGLPGATRPLLPEIAEGMADVPWPVTGTDELSAFAAFLRCAGCPPDTAPACEIFQREDGDGD